MLYKDTITSIKDTLTSLKDITLILVVAALVIFPGIFADWAKRFADEGAKRGAKATVTTGPLQWSFDNNTQLVGQLESVRSINASLRQDIDELRSSNSPQARVKEVQQRAALISSTLDAAIHFGKSSLLKQGSELQSAEKVANPEANKNSEGQYYVVVESYLSQQQASELAKRQNAFGN